MLRYSGVFEPGIVAKVIGNLSAFEVYPHLVAVVAYFYLFADVTERNAVVVTVLGQLDMAVLHDRAHPELHDLKRMFRKGLKRGHFLFKEVLSAERTSLEVPFVQEPQRLLDGRIDFFY